MDFTSASNRMQIEEEQGSLIQRLLHGRRTVLITGYSDLRKAITGLSNIVEYQFEMNPMSGDAFLFCGRRCDRIKILVFDRGAYHLHYVRLETTAYCWPRTEDEAWEITPDQLQRLLGGQRLLKPESRYVFRPAQ